MAQGNTKNQQQGGAGNRQNHTATDNPSVANAPVVIARAAAEAAINCVEPEGNYGYQHGSRK